MFSELSELALNRKLLTFYTVFWPGKGPTAWGDFSSSPDHLCQMSCWLSVRGWHWNKGLLSRNGMGWGSDWNTASNLHREIFPSGLGNAVQKCGHTFKPVMGMRRERLRDPPRAQCPMLSCEEAVQVPACQGSPPSPAESLRNRLPHDPGTPRYCTLSTTTT